jgi:hypothetical protein
MTQTPAQLRASIAYRKKLAEAGFRAVTVRVSPAAFERLCALAKVHGSKDKAVEAWLLGDGPAPVVAAPAPKPPSFSHGRSKTVVVKASVDRAEAVARVKAIERARHAVAVDALTGAPIKRRGAMQKGEGKKR